MQPALHQQAQPIAVDLPYYQGYISVAPSKRYFQDQQGQGFIVIGQNDAITWPGLVELLDQSDPQTAENYILNLRANGVTVSRVMIEYAQFEQGYFEQPVGTFAPGVVRFWDEFIALAEKYGLYLLLTPYDTFWQVRKWETYPYNAACGGMCEKLSDWLTKPEAIAAQKARWEFVIRRWGGSPNIFAWDLMNEVDLYWNASPEVIGNYLTEMATFVRDMEVSLWGKTHMLTVSSAAPTPDTALGQVIYNHPMLDFANTHLYVGPGINSPIDAIECADEMVQGVRLSLQSISQPRPYFDSESGPIYDWIEDIEMDALYHHNMSWAHLISGGAGTGMRWPYTKPHWLLPEMRKNLLGLARFAANIDWTHFASRSVANHIRVSKSHIFKTGCSDFKTCALLWLLTDSRLPAPPSLTDVSVSLHNALPDGDYTVEVWETFEGSIIDVLPVTIVDGKLKFTLSALDPALRDVALIVRKNQD